MTAYSAGTIFLQVVPSFRNFQNSVRRQVREMGLDEMFADEMNRGGASNRAAEEAGKRHGKAFSQGVKSGLAEISRELEKVSRDAGDKSGKAYQGAFATKVSELSRQAAAMFGDIEIDVDTSEAMRELAAMKAALATLSDADIGIDLDATEFLAHITHIERRLMQLEADEVDIDVRADIGAALGKIELIHKAVNSLDRDDVNIRVDVDGAGRAAGMLAMLKGNSKGIAGDGRDAGNAFRALNGYLLAAVTLGPAIVPILGAIAGGLAGIATAAAGAGAGLGVTILGLARIPNAVSALNDVAKNAPKDQLANDTAVRNAQRGIDAASRGIRDAQENIAKARESASKRIQAASRAEADAQRRLGDATKAVDKARQDAADGIERAVKAQVQAERRLQDAQISARKAQDDLVKARRDAQRQLDDMADRAAGGQLAERQAVIDVFEAQQADAAARTDGSATNLDREKASIALGQARLRLKEIREENAALAEEQADALKKGVDGSDLVVAAQEKVQSATQGVADAQDAVSEAVKDVQRAQTDGQERIAEALQSQADAAQGVADAQADAAQAQVDGQRQVRDAQEGLIDAQDRMTDAQENMTAALQKTGDIGSASIQKLTDAFSHLSPEGQNFARFWANLQNTVFKDVEFAAQRGMLPGLQDAIQGLVTKYGPSFLTFVGKMSGVMGTLFEKIGGRLQGGGFERFFQMLDKYAPLFTNQFADAILNVAEAVADIMTAFAPFSAELGDAIVAVTKTFADWAAQLNGSAGFTSFVKYLEKVGPQVFDTLIALFTAIVNLGIGLAPYGEMILKLLEGFLQFISGMDPDTLGAIVFGILALVTAFQLAAAAIAFVSALLAGISTLGVVVAAIVLIIAAIVILYQRNEAFRAFVDAAWDAIQKTISAVADWIVNTAVPWLVGAWQAIAAGASWLWENVLQPIFKFIGDAFTTTVTVISWVWNNVLWPIFQLFGAVVTQLYNFFVKPIFDAIGAAFTFLKDSLYNTYTYFIAPIFDRFGGVLGTLRLAFDTAVSLIGAAWSKLQDVARTPIKWVVDTVLNNGIIKAFNWIADFFHTDHIGNIPLGALADPAPVFHDRYATGGLIRGSSPHKRADNIGILATANEFMQPVDSVDTYGLNFMEAVRSRTFPVEVAQAYSRSATPKRGGTRYAEGGQVAGAGLSFGGFDIMKALSDPLGFLKELIEKPLRDLGDSPFVKAITAVPLKIAEVATDKVKDLFSSFTAAGAGGANAAVGDPTIIPGGRVSWGGALFDPTMVSRLQAAATMAATTWRILQGSFSTTNGGGLSGGTHAGAGAVDLVPADGDWWKALIALRHNLIAAWHRTPAQGFSHHIHGIGIGIPGEAPAAQAQVMNFFAGENGLKGHGPDDGPRVYDTGGWLRPGEMAINLGSRPEPVLSASMWDQLVNGRTGDGSFMRDLVIPVKTDANPDEIADELLWAIKTVKNDGRYAGVGG